MSKSIFGTVNKNPITANNLYASDISTDGTTFNTNGNAAFQGGWKNNIDNMEFSQTNPDGFNLGNMFSGKNVGSTLQGIGAIGGALASVYGMQQQNKFNDDMLDMEKKRVSTENKRRDKKQAAYEAVWATSDEVT